MSKISLDLVALKFGHSQKVLDFHEYLRPPSFSSDEASFRVISSPIVLASNGDAVASIGRFI